MTRMLIWISVGLFLAVLVHLASILSIPALASRTAYDRLSSLPADGTFHLLRAPGPVLPRQDPALVVSVCRYSLKDGPIHVVVPSSLGFLSVSFYTREGLSYYAMHDRAYAPGSLEMTMYTPVQLAEARSREGPDTPENLRIAAPTDDGLVVLRGLARDETEIPSLEALEKRATCRTPG